MSTALGNTHETDGCDLSIAQKNGARHQSARDAAQLVAQRDRQAIGEERHEQVRFDPDRALMKNRPQAEATFRPPE